MMIGVFSISPLDSNCLLDKTFNINKNSAKLYVEYNNKTKGLSEYYNSIIEEAKHEITVLCHHDVSLEYTNLNCLYEATKKFDVVGVAGGLNPKLVEKNLWHWMMGRENYRGIAAHTHPDGGMFLTNFGQTPSRVTLLDGVFLAFNTGKIKKSGARFDKQFLWHHYDIDFSLTCNYNKLKLGVWPILIYHESPGLRDLDDKSWNNSNQKFINKWQSKT